MDQIKGPPVVKHPCPFDMAEILQAYCTLHGVLLSDYEASCVHDVTNGFYELHVRPKNARLFNAVLGDMYREYIVRVEPDGLTEADRAEYRRWLGSTLLLRSKAA